MIEIIKASAGSGKTFTLARKYIMLLLQNEEHDNKNECFCRRNHQNKKSADTAADKCAYDRDQCGYRDQTADQKCIRHSEYHHSDKKHQTQDDRFKTLTGDEAGKNAADIKWKDRQIGFEGVL